MKYIVIAVIGVSALGLLLYVYIFAPASRPDENTPVSASVTRVPSAGTREYKSFLFRFSLLYPDDLQVKQNANEGSKTTIVFENSKTGRGFQIFVIPYKEDKISPERFKMDVPLGVRNDPVDIIIDGTAATMFYSKNTALGDTREVWFIKNGFLYEVTTYRELDTWLSVIMKTWRFLEF